MQPILPPLPIICVQTVLLLCSLLQVQAVENVDFGEHVENQTGVRDSLSRKHHRVYQLYSRTSGKHVQVLGRKILAKGEDGDKFEFMRRQIEHVLGPSIFLSVCVVSSQAQLVVEADTFGSQVRIRGKETNFYLCMNRKGKLVGRKASSGNAECVFIEIMLENNYTAWMSARYVGWYVGFTKRGRPRRGPQTLPNQQDVHFMKRFPPGEQPSLQHSSFTTVSKRGRRTQESHAPPDLHS
ncbi:fibroblast growth factor 18b [Colossoma macropomum]|uniref:fibroblast growth factor 18b n=1 Tax=Colossoma macropomum TaxID=42526 RepID=UPI001863DE03|nr:fibroblast growth factor 18b [Colossoma macropomum]